MCKWNCWNISNSYTDSAIIFSRDLKRKYPMSNIKSLIKVMVIYNNRAFFMDCLDNWNSYTSKLWKIGCKVVWLNCCLTRALYINLQWVSFSASDNTVILVWDKSVVVCQNCYNACQYYVKHTFSNVSAINQCQAIFVNKNISQIHL